MAEREERYKWQRGWIAPEGHLSRRRESIEPIRFDAAFTGSRSPIRISNSRLTSHSARDARRRTAPLIGTLMTEGQGGRRPPHTAPTPYQPPFLMAAGVPRYGLGSLASKSAICQGSA